MSLTAYISNVCFGIMLSLRYIPFSSIGLKRTFQPLLIIRETFLLLFFLNVIEAV